MKLKVKEIMNAVLENDTACIVEILEKLYLLKDGTAPWFTSIDKRVVSIILCAASVAAWHENLDEDLAHELIERTAMTVNIFSFLGFVVVGAEIENEDFDAIPENIRTALCRDDYTDQIARAIEDMDDDIFEAFLMYCFTGKIERLYVKFNLPIIRRIYSSEIIPAHLLFALMASNLREAINECSDDSHDALSVLSGFSLLGAILNGIHDDDDDDGDEDDKEEDHERHCGGRHGGCGGCHGCRSDD